VYDYPVAWRVNRVNGYLNPFIFYSDILHTAIIFLVFQTKEIASGHGETKWLAR
jgi:hypothetical protein